jgi:phospholipid/cholesterol/gamma-HCH transport system substrate-binding protein
MAKSREYKVGAFVLAGLTAIGGVIFLIGEERQLFADKLEYRTSFQDVQGLTAGSTVRMGGIDIGKVTKVGYLPDASDRKIHVSLAVLEEQAPRIKVDSIASIEGKGLLGDKMLSISIGTAEKGVLPAGGFITAKEGEDLAAVMGKFATLPGKIEKVVDNLERTTATLSDDTLQKDIKGATASLHGVLSSLENREGYVGKLLSDPKEAERISALTQNLVKVTGELSQTAEGVNHVLARIRNGPGLAHEVLYGAESQKAVAQFGGAADELRLTLKGIRDGNGIARSVIYGDDASQQTMANLNAMSSDLKSIVADMRAGKGTLGALLVDPSVYEDLKVVLGNVERNKALRALVRYSIRRDEATPSVEDPSPSRNATGGKGGASISSGIAAETGGTTP